LGNTTLDCDDAKANSHGVMGDGVIDTENPVDDVADVGVGLRSGFIISSGD